MIEASQPMLGILADVRRFHEAHGTVDPLDPVSDPDPETVRLRCKLILEETLETLGAGLETGLSADELKAHIRKTVATYDRAPVALDLEKFADGLADLIYVCAGAALALGLQDRFARVWTEVQRANMAKLGGPRREDGKILKPDGWTPPDIHAALFDAA